MRRVVSGAVAVAGAGVLGVAGQVTTGLAATNINSPTVSQLVAPGNSGTAINSFLSTQQVGSATTFRNRASLINGGNDLQFIGNDGASNGNTVTMVNSVGMTQYAGDTALDMAFDVTAPSSNNVETMTNAVGIASTFIPPFTGPHGALGGCGTTGDNLCAQTVGGGNNNVLTMNGPYNNQFVFGHLSTPTANGNVLTLSGDHSIQEVQSFSLPTNGNVLSSIGSTDYEVVYDGSSNRLSLVGNNDTIGILQGNGDTVTVIGSSDLVSLTGISGRNVRIIGSGITCMDLAC